MKKVQNYDNIKISNFGFLEEKGQGKDREIVFIYLDQGGEKIIQKYGIFCNKKW